MAEFSKLVITKKGEALIAKTIADKGTVKFTKVRSSSGEYTVEELEELEALDPIEQEVNISKVSISNEIAVKVEAAFTNTDLTEGYYMRALGLYADDPDEGEILYAATVETSGNCYMPPYNGASVSGAYIKLITTVGNSDDVELVVDPAAVATIGDIQDLQKQVDDLDEIIADLEGYIGYPDESDIYGVEVDFSNQTFTRLAGAVGKEGGADFDDVNAFGGRKRCILADDGTVLAYYGDEAFTTSGALKVAVAIGTSSYPVGTSCQVMVEQPAFYYKVVPMVRDGEKLRKARYYVSDKQINGFKLHPAFIENGNQNDRIYLSAFEGCIQSGSDYCLDDTVTLDTSTQKLSSIGGAKPCSGVTYNLYRSATRALSQNRGAGWEQSYYATVAMSELLMLVEYGTTNMQNAIGRGNVDQASGSGNESENTGASEDLGNASGAVTNSNGIQIVSYRGEENFWGNIWTWIDGINIQNPSDWSDSGAGDNNYSLGLYIADHDFADDTGDDPYKDTGIHPVYTTGAYISAFGYSTEEFDWMFIPVEAKGNSSLPIGDYFWNYNANWRVAILGGGWSSGLSAGAFALHLGSGSAYRYRSYGGRLVYVPSKNAA